MRFLSQRAICYLINQFNICLLIVCVNTPVVRKRQRFNNSENKKTASRKRQWFDEHDNKEGQGLDQNGSKIEGDRYVPLSPLALLPPL